MRPCVRDTTVPRFNPTVEPARTVGFGKRDSARTVGFGNQAVSAREIPEINYVRASVRPSDPIFPRFNSPAEPVRTDATVPRFNSPAELTGRTGRACIFYGRTGPAGEL